MWSNLTLSLRLIDLVVRFVRATLTSMLLLLTRCDIFRLRQMVLRRKWRILELEGDALIVCFVRGHCNNSSLFAL
jgi:hypothetical protein